MLIELNTQLQSQLAKLTARRGSALASADASGSATAIAQQILDLVEVTPVVVIEFRAGIVADVRVHPTETVVVTFDWNDLVATSSSEARQNLQALVDATDQLPQEAQPMLAETLIGAKALVADRYQGAAQ